RDHVRGGDGHVLRERASPVDAQDRDGLAYVRVPGAAHVAPPARDVALRAHVVALPEALHVRADVLDLPRELMALDQRGLDAGGGPRVPVEDVDVRAAGRGDLPSDEDLVWSGLGDRDLLDFRALRRGLEIHGRFPRRDHADPPARTMGCGRARGISTLYPVAG